MNIRITKQRGYYNLITERLICDCEHPASPVIQPKKAFSKTLFCLIFLFYKACPQIMVVLVPIERWASLGSPTNRFHISYIVALNPQFIYICVMWRRLIKTQNQHYILKWRITRHTLEINKRKLINLPFKFKEFHKECNQRKWINSE